MQTDDEQNVDIDLDAFSKDFFTPEAKAQEVAEEVEETEEVAENEDDSLAPEDDDEEATEVEEEEDEESEPEPPKSKKRNRTQERIEKLLEKERLANERADRLEQRLAQLEAQKEVKAETKTPSLREQLPDEAPNPDAIGEDGNPVYELGEFDKNYIRDLTKFMAEQEIKAAKAAEAKEAEAKAILEAQEVIKNKWIDNLDRAEEEIPDIRENIRDLTDTFADIEPQYGEYLASTIMFSDVGPEIMNYLSQNIGEAQKIVASGPAAATLAIGRLEAKFLAAPEEEKKRNTKRVSAAPPPPEEQARGRNGRFEVADDTDDLDAFSRKFYQR